MGPYKEKKIACGGAAGCIIDSRQGRALAALQENALRRKRLYMPIWELECCVDTLESAIAAERGGATRLELCANLVIGGTTPSLYLLEQVQRLCTLPVRCMVRPRYGDFLYSDSEFALMRREVEQFRALGADGVVLGILCPDGSLDVDRMRVLCQAAGDMPVTLHRAFDAAADPMRALRQAAELGIDTILTSGQRRTAREGSALLGALHKAAGQVTILAGGGIHAAVIPALYHETGIGSYHLSGADTVQSPMVYRNPAVSMGLPTLSEYERRECDCRKIAAARAALDALSNGLFSPMGRGVSANKK